VWELTEFAFTLNRLRNPTPEQKIVLDAIIGVKKRVMPAPGDKVRAVAVNRGELQPGRIALAARCLPVQLPVTGVATAEQSR
jgi:hypothetical protein